MSDIYRDLKQRFEPVNCTHKEIDVFPHHYGLNDGFDKFSTKPLRKCGILVVLFRKNGQLCILFTVRSLKLRSFPGQICFPGGKFDQGYDTTLEETAMRETYEEIGLSPKNYKKIAQLCPYLTVDGYCIQPFIALLCHEKLENNEKNFDPFEDTYEIIKNLKLNSDEVDSLVHLPLTYFYEKISSETNDIFNYAHIKFEEDHMSKINMNFNELFLGDLPKSFLQTFFNVNDAYMLYGLNSSLVLIISFLTDQNDSDLSRLKLDIETVSINQETIGDFYMNLIKVSYVVLSGLVFENKSKL